MQEQKIFGLTMPMDTWIMLMFYSHWGKRQTIAEIAQQIKGESSNWINKQKLIKDHFRWQDDYYAVSVSESHLAKVRAYIQKQEEHHRKISFVEEVDQFMKHYGWNLISDDAAKTELK